MRRHWEFFTLASLIAAEKEAKVLTGKSLMALSRVVNEGLTLAVHLELPDSTITGK